MGIHNQFAVLAAALSAIGLLSAEPPALDAQTAVQVEALNRLKGMDLEANASLKAAVLRVVEKTKGTSHYVELVREFGLKGQNEGLLQYALHYPQDSSAAAAIKLLLEDEGMEVLKSSVSGTNASAALQVIGNVNDKRVIPILEESLGNAALEGGARKAAVKALARSQEGARGLIAMAREDKISGDLKLAAASELQLVPWADIKKEAGEVLPLPQSQGDPLPPVAELVKLVGDPKRGAEIYRKPEVACITCHQVNGEGIDFGPKLSEIGTKLGKEALYESILDPSSGISFGYEAWNIETNDGDEAFGLIASDAAEELSLKTQNGIITKYKKSDIAKRQMMKTSIMPAGLQLTMTRQDLVDLVEYLSTLKKKD